MGLISVVFTKDGVVQKTSGTCFFVAYPDDRLGKDVGFGYLVTNRHMAQPGIEEGHPYPVIGFTLRVNKVGSDVSTEEPLALGGDLRWYFSDDDSVDLAVLPLAPSPTVYDYEPFPISVFATQDEVKSKNIAEGDTVIFTGFFYQLPGVKKFEPILREGVLAMMPDEKLQTTLNKMGNLYLADVHAFGGNSGSPLIVNIGGPRNGVFIMQSQYKLLGIISGGYHEDVDMTLTIASTYKGTVQGNSGIATVVPVDALKDLLDSPALKSARDATVAKNVGSNTQK